MKKTIKNRAEHIDSTLALIDGIDDDYLAEALELHSSVTDTPAKARVVPLFGRRLAIAVACLLITVTILPLILITGDFAKKGDVFEPAIPGADYENPNGNNIEHSGILSVGKSSVTFCGELTYLSCENNLVTLSVRLYDGGQINYLLSDGTESGYYSTNYIEDGDIEGTRVDGGVTVTYGEPDSYGYVRVTLDLSPFISETGVDISRLTLSIFGFGEIKLTP